ncbi:Protein CBG26116 [Caenorhabditis briggsae]|uniref:Protein CBG26116 n=1 Tax=Caenorhabditis briggsae TaxID=6238 RepID=B6IE51_CAEBR|nr:Protein CBG26116 [Caenorhabditis briggsae]CAS01115.1 Protein CBG26116 [Caenorhabditis briggsae]
MKISENAFDQSRS